MPTVCMNIKLDTKETKILKEVSNLVEETYNTNNSRE